MLRCCMVHIEAGGWNFIALPARPCFSSTRGSAYIRPVYYFISTPSFDENLRHYYYYVLFSYEGNAVSERNLLRQVNWR